MSAFRPVLARRHRARHRKSARIVLSTLATTASAGLVMAGLGIAGTALSASAGAPENPLAGNHGFTVLTEGDTTFDSTSETEGAWAVGGDLAETGGKYSLIASGHMPSADLPVVDGARTRLLVGGSIAIPSGENSERLNVAPGDGGTNLVVGSSAPAYKTYANGRVSTSANGAYIVPSLTTPISDGAAFATKPSAFSGTFGSSTFTAYRTLSSELAKATGTVTSTSDARLTLTPGTLNVWNVSESELSALQSHDIVFASAKPNATTPLVINLPAGASTFSNPKFAADQSTVGQYVLWNYAASGSFTLTGSNLMSGSILAPNADFTFDKSTPMEGQFVFKSATVTNSGEIHHVPFVPTLTPPAPPATCVSDVAWSYTWDASTGTGTVTATSRSGATGTLCAPLYVRATSWTYEAPLQSTSPSWPQNDARWNDSTVSTTGSHSFQVPGSSCGQDDVYASFAGVDSLALPSTLTGPGAPSEPPFLSSTVRTGTGGPTYATDDVAACPTTLTVAKTAVASGTTTPVSSVEVGQSFDYAIDVANSGDAPAKSVEVTDTIPADLTVGSLPASETGDSSSSGWSCSVADHDLDCTLRAPLAAGTHAALIRVPVTVRATDDTSIANTAKVCASNAPCATDDATVTLVRAGLSIVKDASTGSTERGGTYAYTITVTNTGAGTAHGVDVTDTLASDLTPGTPSVDDPAWACTISGRALDCAPADGTLAAGHRVVITVPVTVSTKATASTISNTAKVCATDVTPCVTGSTDVPVLYPRIAIDKNASVSTANPGDGYDYTLSVSNPGTGPANPVMVTDDLPAGLTAAGAPSADGWTVEPITTPGHYRFVLDGPLAAGATAPLITIPVKVAASVATSAIVNDAKACADNAINGCATDEVTVTVPPVVPTPTPTAPTPASHTPTAPTSAALASTGVNVLPIAATAGGVLVLGLGILLLSRARRSSRRDG